MGCSERSKFSSAGEVSDASNRVLYHVTPEEQLTSSSSVEGGVRSGTQEQGEIRERSVPELAAELGEDEGDVEEEARTAKPLRDPRDPTAAERAIHEATHLPFRSWCAESDEPLSSPRRERSTRNLDGLLLCPT